MCRQYRCSSSVAVALLAQPFALWYFVADSLPSWRQQPPGFAELRLRARLGALGPWATLSAVVIAVVAYSAVLDLLHAPVAAALPYVETVVVIGVAALLTLNVVNAIETPTGRTGPTRRCPRGGRTAPSP